MLVTLADVRVLQACAQDKTCRICFAHAHAQACCERNAVTGELCNAIILSETTVSSSDELMRQLRVGALAVSPEGPASVVVAVALDVGYLPREGVCEPSTRPIL